MSQPGSPTPERIFQIINAYQSSAALKGALDLGLFTALGGDARTAGSLAESLGASEKGVRVLCDFLTAVVRKGGTLMEGQGTVEPENPIWVDFARNMVKPGGRAVTLEFVPNDDRITPPEQASFALIMLATTAAGDAYTFAELEAMAAEAGFSTSELHRIEGPPQSVIVSRR